MEFGIEIEEGNRALNQASRERENEEEKLFFNTLSSLHPFRIGPLFISTSVV
jgi:hypothetical protein